MPGMIVLPNEGDGGTVHPNGTDSAVARRDFLALTGLTIAGATLGSLPVMAGPFAPADFDGGAPGDKRLRAEWLASLTARGAKTVYRGSELDKIGMPIGGIGAGQLYLGGDGRLWHWDIFNIPHGTGDANYAHPPMPSSPLDQGFELQVTVGGVTDVRPLERTGFRNLSFNGQYPIGTVEYRDDACPITLMQEAFSPFIPLNTDDSSLPATILHFTLRNTGKKLAKVSLTGRMENAICLQNRLRDGIRRNRVLMSRGATFLNAFAEKAVAPPREAREDIVFEAWGKPTYEGWTVEGDAFGNGPIRRADVPLYQGEVGGEDDHVVNSHSTAPGASVGEKDGRVGKLTSRAFTIDRGLIRFWIGGGAHKGKTCLNLLVTERLFVRRRAETTTG